MTAPIVGMGWRGAVAAVLVLCLAAAPLAAQEGSDSAAADRDRAAGYLDGERDATGNGVWLLSGLLLGPFGLVLPWVFSPKVPGGNLIGKSAEYVQSYTQAYKAKARKRNFLYSLGGLGILTATALVASTVYVLHGCASASGNACWDSADGTCLDPAIYIDTCCSMP